MIALDASALLAYLFAETGAPAVAEEIVESCISTVNLAEVVGKFVERGIDGSLVTRQIGLSTVEMVPFSVHEAERAASLLPQARALGLSLADRACLALALGRGIPVLTADRAWADLELPIEIRVIR
jgi:PIN domain nuclease of toxin-antitoxin system